MITKLRVSNFYSIGKLVELDFTKGGKAKEDGYLLCKDRKVSAINGFYGANASGKSTFLRALQVIIKIIYNKNPYLSFNINENKILTPNLHSEFKDLPTQLGFDILLDNKLYKYDIEIFDGIKIKKEELSLIDINVKSAKGKDVFIRNGEKITFGSDFKDHEAYFSAVKLSENQTLMSHLIESFPAGNDFRNYKDNFFLKTDDFDSAISPLLGIILTINNLLPEKRDKMMKVTKDVMSRFDKTIKDVALNTENNNITVKVTHEGFYDKVDIMRESAGTRELFSHIFNILESFSRGGIVVYDETNRYFHPEIEAILISLFKNNEINTANAQLFFASHNHDTLSLLNLDQIFIVEKEKHNSTTYKVSDLEDVRSRDNLKKKYNLGLLGGVPDVIDFQHTLKQFL